MTRIQVVLLSLLLMVPVHSYAADITVNISAGYIDEVLTKELSDFLEGGGTDFGIPGDVELVDVMASMASQTAIHFVVSLEFSSDDFPIPIPVTVAADIAINCDANGPRMELTALSVNSLVPVPPEQVEAVRIEAARMLQDRSQSMIKPIWDELGDIPGASRGHHVCPHVEIGANGSVLVEVDYLYGCINGATRRMACGPGGIIDRCRNGAWFPEQINCH